jgi:hypothetical protein
MFERSEMKSTLLLLGVPTRPVPPWMLDSADVAGVMRPGKVPLSVLVADEGAGEPPAPSTSLPERRKRTE